MTECWHLLLYLLCCGRRSLVLVGRPFYYDCKKEKYVWARLCEPLGMPPPPRPPLLPSSPPIPSPRVPLVWVSIFVNCGVVLSVCVRDPFTARRQGLHPRLPRPVLLLLSPLFLFVFSFFTRPLVARSPLTIFFFCHCFFFRIFCF